MSYADQVYIKNCERILTEGVRDDDLPVRPHWEDGTPAHTIKLFGVVNRYDLQKEFPIMTLRRTYWKSAIDELLWIWQKKSNNVHDLGSHVWDAWADEGGSIGKAYGYQLAKKDKVSGVDIKKAKALFGKEGIVYLPEFNGRDHCGDLSHVVVSDAGTYMDQVDKVLYDLKYSAQSRRILTSMYNFAELTEMALSPCAYSMTFNVSGNKLNAILNQRSQDMLTANNWNVVQYAALLMMFAQVSGLVPGELVHVIADCHIYDRHIPMVEEMIDRGELYPAPTVKLDPTITDFYAFTKNSFSVENYRWNSFDHAIPVAV